MAFGSSMTCGVFRWLRFCAVLLMITGPWYTNGSSLTFEVPYGQRKCYSEDLPPRSTIRGTVSVSSGKGEMSLDLFVSDERGSVYFHKSDVNMVKFSFQTGSFQQHTMKPYSFCVINQVHKDSRSNPGAIRRVTLEVEVENQDNRKTEASRLAKQSHAEKVYTDFLSVSSDVDRLIEKMDDLREKEKALSELNEQTATTILRISVIACLFTIGTGVLNFLSLKTFFKRKKLA